MCIAACIQLGPQQGRVAWLPVGAAFDALTYDDVFDRVDDDRMRDRMRDRMCDRMRDRMREAEDVLLRVVERGGECTSRDREELIELVGEWNASRAA